MVNESALRDTLVSFARESKSIYELLAVTQAEVSALRETVRALDPTFSENLEARKNAIQNLIGGKFANVIAYYDEIIRKLEGGYVC